MNNLAIQTDYEKEQAEIKACEDNAKFDKYIQIKAAQKQINLEGKVTADILNVDNVRIDIAIARTGLPTLHIPFSFTKCGLTKALAYINRFVTVSPAGSSSAMDGTHLGGAS